MMAIHESQRNKAHEVLENLKSRISNILWDDHSFGYNHEHMLIPWIQEEAEYAIQELGLPKSDEEYFIKKIEQLIGEYREGT
jgi:uncharacterized coiled-coil DUF342 family protein